MDRKQINQNWSDELSKLEKELEFATSILPNNDFFRDQRSEERVVLDS